MAAERAVLAGYVADNRLGGGISDQPAILGNRRQCRNAIASGGIIIEADNADVFADDDILFSQQGHHLDRQSVIFAEKTQRLLIPAIIQLFHKQRR